MRPYLVSEIRGYDGKVLARFGPETRRQAIAPETARELAKILQGTVAPGGTGEKAAVAGFTAAGKTGTAQRVDPETRRYSDYNYVSSFVGFVPSDDPRIAVLIVVDSPQGPAWGGTVVGPVFKEIAEQTLRYMNVIPPSQERLLLVAR